MTVEQSMVGEQLRRLRASSGLSVRTLAVRSGFSASFISQIENGQVSPSIASLERIAGVLGVTLAGFFSSQRSAEPVVRSRDRQEVSSTWSKARIESLGPVTGSSRLEAVMITLAPGGRSGARPASHPGEEFALVFEGTLALTLGEECHQLERGDTASFSSGTPHLWENRGEHAAQVVIVSSRFTH